MKKKWKKSYSIILAIVILLLVWTAIFTRINIHELVAAIGVRNGYLLALGVALLGGVSTFTTASFFTTIGVLSIGGLNPLFLGLVTAPALLLGDFIFYYLGTKGRTAVSEKNLAKIKKVEAWFEKKPVWFRPVGIYFYTAFTPLPADILMIALALIGYKFRKALLAILLGHITIVTWLGYLAKVTEGSVGF